MKLLLSYMKPYRRLALLGVFVKIVATVMLLLIPYVLEHLVDKAVPTKELGRVVLWGLVMIALAFVERLLNLKSNRISVKVTKDSVYALRQDLFSRAIELSGGQADRFGLPSLTSRLTGDIYNVQGFMQNLQTFAIRAPILVIGSVALTLTMDPGLAAILCVLAPLMVAVVALVSWKGIPLYAAVQKKVDQATRILRENITGVRVVKALAKEEYECRRFAGANSELAGSDQRAGAVMSLPGPVVTLILNVGLVVIVLVGAKRVDSGLTQPGVILAFLTWFNFLLMGVMGLNRIFMMLSKAKASANRISAVLDQPEELPVLAQEGDAAPESEACIVFDHVSFGYGAEPDAAGGAGFAGGRREMSLSDVSFSVKKGGSLGIIGSTGCGKTTIINLLMRFYDVTEGRILVDGRDVRGYDKDELRGKFGAVFQNGALFADTFEENIAFGREVSEAQLKSAASDAMAREFIEACDGGFAHRITAHGTDLSGGQRQRVLIARALAADPEILILDDASSALDYKTDAALRKAIQEHHGGTTTIIVAQRISSILHSDEILVLDEGRIIGRGTHETLLRECPQYQEIYKTQMGEAV